MSQDPQMSPSTAAGNRRSFLKIPLAAGTGALVTTARPVVAQESLAATDVIDEYDPANIKIAHRVSATASDEDLLFLQQIGLRWARVNFGNNEDLDFMRRTQQRFASRGMQIFAAVHSAYRDLAIQLGRAGRDEMIERYCTFLVNLGRLGIPVSCYDFHPANTYTTGHVQRRGYLAREFSLKHFRERIEKQRFDREYDADELWDYYSYFVKAVLPVAEGANVKLALHPDDPPVSKMNGVAKLFTHYEGYRRAEEIAGGSPSWGLNFCVGTWSEGGDKMGKDVFEMIHDFGSRGKILDVHFRNITAPLPHFIETFPDDGYMDMYQVMKALRKVGYSGTAVPDHIPQLAGDTGIRRAGTAYCIAYMRSLLRRANEEVG